MRNFDESYLKIAEVWSKNSYATKAKVGAIIVKDNQIISDGFNGTPAGFENECEYYKCIHNEIPETCKRCTNLFNQCESCDNMVLKTKPYVLHAEANAITKCAKTNVNAKGSTLYITMAPCIDCAKLIIQAGIERVVYIEDHLPNGIDILERAGIKVEKHKKNKKEK